MTIDASDKLITSLQALTRDEVQALPPAERRRLIESLIAAHRVALSATMTPEPEKGVLRRLKEGERSP
jgi:hypothetical protein